MEESNNLDEKELQELLENIDENRDRIAELLSKLELQSNGEMPTMDFQEEDNTENNSPTSIIPDKYLKYNLIPNHVKNNKDIYIKENPDKNNWCVVKYIGITTDTYINGNYYFFIPYGENSLYSINETERIGILFNYPISLFDLIEDPNKKLYKYWADRNQ